MNDQKVYGIRTAICKKCGKEFIPAPMHVFKEGTNWYCKWTCFNHRKEISKEDIAYENNKD